MGVRLYDEALWNKIQKMFHDNHLMILKVDETERLFSTRAHNTDDKPITLPLITISRAPDVQLDLTTKRNMSYDGKHLKSSESKTLHLDAIPITINYQIDIYTKNYSTGDEFLRELIFHFVNHPTLEISYMYNGVEMQSKCYVRLSSTATDNSDIPQKIFPDQFTRWSLYLETEGAYLWSIPLSKNAKIVDATMDVLTDSVEMVEKDGGIEEEIIHKDEEEYISIDVK